MKKTPKRTSQYQLSLEAQSLFDQAFHASLEEHPFLNDELQSKGYAQSLEKFVIFLSLKDEYSSCEHSLIQWLCHFFQIDPSQFSTIHSYTRPPSPPKTQIKPPSSSTKKYKSKPITLSLHQFQTQSDCVTKKNSPLSKKTHRSSSKIELSPPSLRSQRKVLSYPAVVADLSSSKPKNDTKKDQSLYHLLPQHPLIRPVADKLLTLLEQSSFQKCKPYCLELLEKHFCQQEQILQLLPSLLDTTSTPCFFAIRTMPTDSNNEYDFDASLQILNLIYTTCSNFSILWSSSLKMPFSPFTTNPSPCLVSKFLSSPEETLYRPFDKHLRSLILQMIDDNCHLICSLTSYPPSVWDNLWKQQLSFKAKPELIFFLLEKEDKDNWKKLYLSSLDIPFLPSLKLKTIFKDDPQKHPFIQKIQQACRQALLDALSNQTSFSSPDQMRQFFL